MQLIPSGAQTAVNVTVAFTWIGPAMQPGSVLNARSIIVPKRLDKM